MTTSIFLSIHLNEVFTCSRTEQRIVLPNLSAPYSVCSSSSISSTSTSTSSIQLEQRSCSVNVYSVQHGRSRLQRSRHKLTLMCARMRVRVSVLVSGPLLRPRLRMLSLPDRCLPATAFPPAKSWQRRSVRTGHDGSPVLRHPVACRYDVPRRPPSRLLSPLWHL